MLRPEAREWSRRGVIASATVLTVAPALATSNEAARIYARSIVIDGNLIVDPLLDTPVLTSAAAARVRASGLTAVKQTLGDTGASFADAMKLVAELRAAIARNPSLFLQITQADDVRLAKRTGRVGVVLSFEAANMLEGELGNIDRFADAGVRVMGLSYNKGSPFGGGTLQAADAGLTPLGQQAIERMAAKGVTVDLSHSNEATSFQALAVARAPMLITHAGAAAVHPHPRNKSDALLRAVAAAGGVTGIYDLSYLGNYPAYPTVETYMRHLTRALDVCGEDHVGIGSDSVLLGMDTSPDAQVQANKHEEERRAAGVAAPEELAIPYVIGLNRPDRAEVICRELLRRGYGSRAVEKVLGANFLRVFAKSWSASGQLQESQAG